MPNIMEEMQYIDGMIWIGKSYKKILCEDKTSCGVPVKNQRNKCYVHEAEWRGCCRKIPDIPKWMVPGRSKIFLVHRDNFKGKDQGRIFGYFVLERIEALLPSRKIMPRAINPTSPLLIKRFEKIIKEGGKPIVLRGTVYRSDNGRPLQDAQIKIEPENDQGGETTKTDNEGAYKFELRPGRFRLTASAQGFASETINGLEIKLEEKIDQDFYLTPKAGAEGDMLEKMCWNGEKIVTHHFQNGRWVPSGKECPEFPDPKGKTSKCKNGSVLKQKCWNGSTIVTHRCENGKWVATGEECPDLPEDPDCEDGAVIKKRCPNGSVIVVYRCQNGEWVPTGTVCPNKPLHPIPPDPPYSPEPIPVPIDFSMFETHRSCSLRFIPGGIYLVDPLTADITDAFNLEIRETNIWKHYQQAGNDKKRMDSIEEGNQLFKDVLIRFRKNRKARTVIPHSLKGKVELRGELVLLKKPPIFKSQPRASFLGLRQIDGERLLQQIAAGVKVPEIPYYTTKDSPPKDMMITEISREYQINQATSERIFKRLLELFAGELQKEKKLSLPGFGTFKVAHSKARKGRNPQTGQEIKISARNTVRFKAAKKLKEEVKTTL